MPEPMLSTNGSWYWYAADFWFATPENSRCRIPVVLFEAMPMFDRAWRTVSFPTRAAALRAYDAARERVLESDGRYKRRRA